MRKYSSVDYAAVCTCCFNAIFVCLYFIRSVMFERLGKYGREFEKQTREHINEYADAGLRTLVLAYREIDEEEYEAFNKEYSEAKNLVSADRDEILEEVAEKMEKDLILLGATAVEDKLQNGVYHFSEPKLLNT